MLALVAVRLERRPATAEKSYGYHRAGVLAAFSKTYKQKPYGAERDEVNKLYDRMRVGRSIENILTVGDRCATSGTTILGNAIDLRPFYAIAPTLATQLGPGVTRATVTFTY